jgi:hypothetical protein
MKYLLLLIPFLVACSSENFEQVDPPPLDSPHKPNFTQQQEANVYDYFYEKNRSDDQIDHIRVIGVDKVSDQQFWANTVYFKGDSIEEKSFDVFLDGEKVIDVSLLESVERSFSEVTELDRKESGAQTISIQKHVLPVTFQTLDGLEIDSFLGRYDLVYADSEQEQVIDYSFDPFSTNVGFELLDFEGDRYFTYYKQDFAKLYTIYDLKLEQEVDLQVPGVIRNTYFTEDKVYICTQEIDYQEAVISLPLEKLPNHQMNDWQFLYPAETVGKNFEEIKDILKTESYDLTELSCYVDDNGQFIFEEIDFPDGGRE